MEHHMHSNSRSSNSTKEIVLRGVLVLATGSLLTLLAACGTTTVDADTPTETTSSSSATEEPQADAGAEADDSAVTADLEAAAAAVSEAIVSYPDAAQIVLSSSVTELTFAYGAAQVPFIPSDATKKISGTVTIADDGSFEISATADESGNEYTINQAGEISGP
jgi:hypothetical protein